MLTVSLSKMNFGDSSSVAKSDERSAAWALSPCRVMSTCVGLGVGVGLWVELWRGLWIRVGWGGMVGEGWVQVGVGWWG